MKNRDAFSAFHPAVLCGYYALILVFSMFLTHPLCLAASLLGALSYAAKLRGGRAVLRSLAWMAPVWLLAAAVNTLFNHEGATILTYFSSGNPLTLESMLYGLSAGGMLAAVLLWFTTYQAVMTSDKFVYLFGRAIPALSLVLSMTLRFVPKFRAQLRAVQQARQFAGHSEKKRPNPESPDFRGKFLDFSDVEPGKCRRNGGFHARARLRPAGPDGVFDFPL